MKIQSGQPLPSEIKSHQVPSVPPVKATAHATANPSADLNHELSMSTQGSKHFATPLTFLEPALPPEQTALIESLLENHSAQDIQALIQALDAQARGLASPEQEALISNTLTGLQSADVPSFTQELRVQNALSALKSARFISKGVTLSLLHQLRKSAQNPNLTADQYRNGFPEPFIKLTQTDVLRDPQLLPHLERLVKETEPIFESAKTHIPRPTSDLGLSAQMPVKTFENAQQTQLYGQLSDTRSQLQQAQQERLVTEGGIDIFKSSLAFKREKLARLTAEHGHHPQDQQTLNERVFLNQDIRRLEKSIETHQTQLGQLSSRIETLQDKSADLTTAFEQTSEAVEYFSQDKGRRGKVGRQGESPLAQLEQVLSRHAVELGAHIENQLRPSQRPLKPAAINLEDKLNYAFAEVLNPQNRSQLDALEGILNKEPKSVTSADKAVLKTFGLYVQGNTWVNLMDRQMDMTPQHLSAIKTTVAQVKTMATTVKANPSGVFAVATTSFEGLLNARKKVDTEVAGLETANRELGAANDRVETLTREANDLRGILSNEGNPLGSLTDIVRNLRSLRNSRDLQDYIRKLASNGQLGHLNAALKHLNIQVEVRGNQVRFKNDQGHALNPATFVAVAEHQLSMLERRVDAKLQELEEAQGDLESKRNNVLTRRQSTEVARNDLAQQLESARHSRTQLLAIKNNPELWAQLSPEQQSQLDTWLQELEHEISNGENSLRRADRALAQADQELQRAALNLLNLQFLLNDLKLQLGDIQAVLSEKPNQGPPLAAQSLDFQRQLKAEPAQSQDIAQEWLEALKDAAHEAEYRKQAQEIKAFDQRITDEFQAKMRDALDYHIAQIEKLLQDQSLTPDALKASLLSF